MRLLLVLLALPALAAAGEQGEQRLVIPDQLVIDFSTEEEAVLPPVDPAELERRAASHAPVAPGDAIDLVGHIERGEYGDDLLTVVGRQVDIRFADIRGGASSSIHPGTLVRVRGTGGAYGRIDARTLEIQPGRDPSVWHRLGRDVDKFEEKYWTKRKRFEDPDLQRYLDGIARRLLPAYLEDEEREFELAVVEDPSLNAFALPNGDVVLHTGIIARMENEAQLAAIVGHELAHYTQRHALRSIEKATEHKLIGWGSMLAALALGMTGQGDAAQGVELMSSAYLSGYSRGHEDEADKVGLRYMYLAGYDVREAPKVWRTFELLYGNPSREANFFYGSHSIPSDRRHHLSAEVWKSYEPSGLVGGRVGREDFLHATARLVRENALLDLERGNPAWAEWGIGKALEVAPEDPESYVALAKLALRGGGREGLERAADAYSHVIELDPERAVAHRELGFIWMRLGEVDRARRALNRYLVLAPEAEDAERVRRQLKG